MKVFLISSPYIELCLIELIEDFLNVKIKELFLLYENHPKGLSNCLNNTYSVSIVSNIESGIDSCDIVFIIETDFLSQDFINRVGKRCNILQKKLLICKVKKNDNFKFLDEHSAYLSKLPSILMLGISEANQFLKNERLLYKALCSQKINVICNFQYFLSFQNKKDDNLSKINGNITDPDLLFCSIDGYDIINHNNSQIREKIVAIKPDYLIVSLDRGLSDYKYIDQHFYYNYGLNVDAFVTSDYMLFESAKKFVVGSKNKNILSEEYGLHFDNNYNDFLKISKKIIERTAYPPDIIPLN